MGNRIFGVECLLASYLLDYPQRTFFELIKKEQRLKPGRKWFFVDFGFPLMFCEWLVLHQRTRYQLFSAFA